MLSFLQSREKILATSLIVLFFLLNLSIASRSPFGGSMDEVGYVDPGLNLVAGKGWTSTVDPWQTDHQFFAAGSPLYPAALALWVHVFGISMVSCRAYCYFLAAVGMFLLWLGTFRLNLLTPAYRLLWIVILSSEYGMNWMARSERYDAWIFIGMALAWLGASLRNPLAKYSTIFMGCFLIPFAGFIGITYVFLVTGLVIILTRLKCWKEALSGMAGVGSGVVGVALFYLAFGSLQAFQDCVRERTVSEQIKDHSLLNIFLYPVDDPGVAVMICLLVVLSFYYAINRSPGSAPWLGLGWGMVILMPCIMVMRGAFNMMYFYMLIVPLSLAILLLTQQALSSARGRYLAVAITVVMGMLSLGGLPARIYTSVKEWDYRNPQNIHDFVRTYVHPNDAVYTDYLFYFELRDYAAFVAMPWYCKIVPPDEAARINVAIVRDDELPDLTQDIAAIVKIGGGWKKVAVFPTAEMQSKFPDRRERATYTLYRRDTASP